MQKKRKQKKPTNRKNRAVCFFLRHEYLNTYVQRDTEEKKRKATVCLARPTNKEEKNDNNSKKKERESDDHAHAHAHTHIKNGTRDEVREKNGG